MKEGAKENKNKKYKVNEKLEDMIMNYEPQNQRSYSCSVNEKSSKKFSGCDEIRLNISKKFNFLKTPQLKPKKGNLNPIPINIGIVKKKAPRFKPPKDDDSIDKNIFNDIISEGEKEVSQKESSVSSSDYSDKEELKNDEENNINLEDENQINDVGNLFGRLRLHSESKIYSFSGLKIKEENEDEFNEEGNIMLKNIRRKMFQTKKSFLKNDNDNFDVTNHTLNEKYKKFKEDILMPKKVENFHNTISFEKPRNKGTSILEVLRKKSSIDKTKSN